MSDSRKNDAPSPLARLLALARLEHADLWLKFLLALVGLALAFAAALFSTVSRESGNVWATFILASAALILATLVGLTTVPHLARRVVVKRLRDAVDYEVTRAGIMLGGAFDCTWLTMLLCAFSVEMISVFAAKCVLPPL